MPDAEVDMPAPSSNSANRCRERTLERWTAGRSPSLLQSVGLEWLHRAWHDHEEAIPKWYVCHGLAPGVPKMPRALGQRLSLVWCRSETA